MGALDDLIANPRTPKATGGPTRAAKPVKGASDVSARLAALRLPQASTAGPQTGLKPVDLSILAGSSAGAKKKGESTIHQIGSGIGSFLGKAIDVVDTPRAALVSGAKELADFADSITDKGQGSWYNGEDNQASWRDFLDQTSRNIGFGEIIQNSGLNSGNKNVNRVLGFAGDVALDPLSYVGVGVGTQAAKAGETAAEGALRLAVKGGARKEIASELVRAGASDKLIALAAERGRGALTKRGLAKAGADAAEVEKFGGLIKGVGVGGRNTRLVMPGTTAVAGRIEDAKGALKQTLGRSAAAKTIRTMRVSEDLGERAFINTIRSAGKTVEEKAVAAKGLSVINESRGLPARFVKQSELSLKKNLGEDLKGLSKDESRQLVDALEGVTEPSVLSGKVREWFDTTAEGLRTEGVELGARENYVPHRVTDEFRVVAKDNPEMKQFVERLSKTEALQGQRSLVAGEKFLGVDLKTGTIKEINDIASAKFGVKALEDDARVLIGQYMSEAGHAYGRHVTSQKLLEAGVGKPTTEAVIGDLADPKEILKTGKLATKSAAKQAEIVDEAISTRQGALKKARVGLDRQMGAVKTRLDEVTAKLTENRMKVEAAQQKVLKLTSDVEAQQLVVNEWKKVAGSARRVERKALNKKIADAETQIAALTAELDHAKEFITRWGAGTEQAMSDTVGKLDEALTQAYDQRAGIDAQLEDVSGPVPNADSPLVQEKRLAAETRKMQTAVLRLERSKTAADAAVMATALHNVPLQDLVSALERDMERLVSARGLTTNLPQGGKRLETKMATRDALRERTSTVMAVLRDTADPAVEKIARIEAQASLYDMKAWKQSTGTRQLNELATAMSTPGFREHMATVVDDGFREIAKGVQVPEWVDEAMTVTHQLRDPKVWDGALKYYKQSLNWWKAWAVTSPGFVIRNIQGGIFNMYLDGVSMESGRIFSKFLYMFEKNPDNYMELAVAKFGPEVAQRLDDSLVAAGATGWGLVPQEVSTALVDTKASWNPLRADNKATRPVRKTSEVAEAWMRGTHAFDVLSRGGSIDMAAARVNKFHFNYRDITDFDRNAKLVSPFWTFYSRNLALQAEVWTKMPQKLNRTYFNLKRNMEYGQDEEVTPEWMVDAGAIRTPWKTGGDSLYWTPDIPSLRFAQDASGLGSANDFISNLAPAPKLIMEMQAGRQSFNDAPFKDSYSLKTRDNFGNTMTEAREAPWWSQMPGISQVLQGVGATQTYADGTPVMTDRTQYLLESMAPPLGRLNSLFPNQANKQQTGGTAWAGFLGAGVRQNTPQMQESELWRRRNALAELEAQQKDLGYAG